MTVTSQPTFTFSSLPALCVDGSAPISLQGYTDATTTFSGTGVSSGSFDPFSAGVGTHTITASRTANGCTYTTTQNITVNAQPTFTFNTLPSVCVDAGTVSLQGYTNATTSFSGTGVSSNVFNPSTAGVGTHTITATRTVSGCSYATTQSITVKALPTFTFNALPSVCVDASSFDLQSYTTATTTFSAPEGVSGTTFNPAVAGTGTHTVTATRIVNGCAYVTTRTITVHPIPTFTFSALPAQCSNGASLSLQTYTNQTTTFSGTGVSSNAFNPATAGVGTHTITASRTVNGCVYATTQSIVVNAAPNFTFSTIAPVCADAAIVNLQTYTNQTTTFSGTGVNVSTSEFDPNVAGAGTHTITATQTSGGCSYVTTRDVVVELIPALASGVNVERFGTGAITLTATPGTNGNSIQWYSSTSGGASIGTGTSYTVPDLSSTTTYYAATYNTSTQCEDLDRAAITATVLAVPTVSTGGGVLKMRPEETLTLTASAGHTNYEWFKDNVQVQNGASNELVIDRPGDYTVTITSSGNATVTTDVVSISSHLDTDENSVITYTFREAISASNPNPFDYTKEQVSINASIYDGLGRPLQNVSLRSSPNGNDMVAPIEYDSLGRKIKEYLPYESTGTGQIYQSTALVDQPGFYQGVKSTDKAYAETRYESSPLNRPLEQGAPGDTWQIGQRTMKYAYDMADSAEVIQWKFETLLSASKAVYDSGQLYENTTFDEDSSQMVTYTDRLGRTILKKSQVDATAWAETYYIYDVFDQLAVVLPPEATARLDTAFFNKSATDRAAFLNTWAFLYDYDGLKRMTMKKVPGADSVFMVYDQWDRLVLTQDGNQRKNKNQWLFTKYDALNRPVMTGLATIAGTTEEVRNAVDSSSQRSESFSALGVNEYTDLTFPPNDSVDNYLTVTYYDYYQWDTTGLSYTGPAGLIQDTVRSQVTGALTKTGSGGWIKSVSYYDDKYRVIQTQSTNHLGGTDIVTNDHDFIGQVTKSVSAHNNGTTTRTTTRRFTYDHVGRLLNTWHELSEDVQWTDMVGVSASGNELTKTAAQSWSNAGAASVQQIPEGSDGAVYMTVYGTGHNQMLGFSQVNDGPGYTTIDFAIYPSYGGLYVYEDGTSRGQFGTYASGDVLKVQRTGTTITYLKNDTVVYTSSINSTGSIIADVSIYEINEKMNDVRISFDEVQIASNTYNELGELIEKDLHAGTGGTFAQSIDYTYNVRGWLTSIDSADLSTSPDGDLFGMELFYDVQDGSLNNSQLYNGNISSMKWSNYDAKGGAINERAYNFSYDKLNRLKTASHYQDNTSTNKYGVQGLDYDLNGNIEGLQRRAQSTTAFMDDLSYAYVGNQLRSVSDAATDTTGFYDGFTANVDTADYEYDANGNMVKDRNKGIDSIYYNHLNLPTAVILSSVEGDSILYLYDAAGIKLQQQVYDSGVLVKTTDYVGEYIYEDGALQLIQHEEGRIASKLTNGEIVFSKLGYGLNGFTPNANVLVSSENGRVKVIANQEIYTPGIWPIDGDLTVTGGETFTFQVKGYSKTGSTAYIYAWTNNSGNIVWRTDALPVGESNEDWITKTFTVPSGNTVLKVGVLFDDSPTIGDEFYIRAARLEKGSVEYN